MDRFKNMGYDNTDYRNQGYYDNGGYMGGDQSYMGNPLAMNFAEQMGGMAGAAGGLEGVIPPNDQNMNYYQEYCRLYIANVVLTNQMKELIAEKNELLTRLTELEKGQKNHREHKEVESAEDKKTRIRRKATEVERHYICPNTSCQKSYGSEGSLFQHVKLKHPEITEDPDWKMKLHKPENEEGST